MMFDTENLHASMAGSGNPYRVLTGQRTQIIRALHESYDLSEIQEKLRLTVDVLHDELSVLIEASLVAEVDGEYKPSFFVADRNETSRVVEHAMSVGDLIFRQLSENWDRLSKAFAQLALSKKHSLNDVGLLFVGANILDIGLLEGLAREASLLPKAPHRPAPGYPEAHYYFFMIEGEPHHAGKYGQKTMSLPYNGWTFFTFGQYHIGQQVNDERRSLEDRVQKSSAQQGSPQQLAVSHQLPLIDAADVTLWLPVVKREAKQLMSVYIDNQASIRQLHASLRGGRTAAETFGEFFCWYDHLAYSHVIDLLEQSGLIYIPDARFMGALWEGNPGPGFFASLDDE